VDREINKKIIETIKRAGTSHEVDNEKQGNSRGETKESFPWEGGETILKMGEINIDPSNSAR